MHQTEKKVNAFLIGVNEVLTDWTIHIHNLTHNETGMKKK